MATVIVMVTLTLMVDGPLLMVRIHVLLSLEVQIKTDLVALMMMGTVTVILTRQAIMDLFGM